MWRWTGWKHWWGECSLYWCAQNRASTQCNKRLRKKRGGQLAYVGACVHESARARACARVGVCVCVHVAGTGKE